MDTGRFIRTMLGPHHAEYSQLGDVGRTAHDVDDLLVFFRAEAVLLDDFGRDNCLVHLLTISAAKRNRDSIALDECCRLTWVTGGVAILNEFNSASVGSNFAALRLCEKTMVEDCRRGCSRKDAKSQRNPKSASEIPNRDVTALRARPSRPILLSQGRKHQGLAAQPVA